MGMSVNVYGVKPADEKFRKMQKIWEMCEEMDVEIPEEVVDFFDNERPDDAGVIEDLGSYYFSERNHESVEIYSRGSSSGFEVDVEKLPKDIKKIRFVMSH